MHALAFPPPDVRHGQRLSPSDLRDTARELIDEKRLTQEQVAARLGVSQAAIGAALGSEYLKRAGTLVRIIEALAPSYRLHTEKRVEFVVERTKAKGSEGASH